ncbi:MAG TPA: response regulator [Gammaproteobacteria bacterium]|nr:response regulator [Gammaproteobacteria bacterium]
MDKRLALVVDDSRTARETLKRMLDKHGLDVDTLESAQQALDYLQGHTPDVIFMDHMMPGMDGFQAVEAIKGNPDTATIPIMMYTSKEGDLYVSQARALGAIGILPKQVEPAELFEVLSKLGLVSERRRRATESNRFVLMDNVPELALSAAREEIQEIAEQAAQAVGGKHDAPGTQGHLGELLEDYHHEMVENMQELKTALDAQAARGSHPLTPLLVPLVIMLMLIPLLWIYHDSSTARAKLGDANLRISKLVAAQQDFTSNEHNESSTLRQQLSQRDDHARRQARLLYDSITWAINQGSSYDVHEEAFSDRRLAMVQELVSRLRSLGFHGTVQLESHLGEFCLSGNDVDGYVEAPADLPVTACDLVGHPLQQLPGLGERQSIAFANFIATSPLVNSGDIDLEIASFLFSRPRIPYPPQGDTVTAYEWNRVAAANNRVDVRLVPDTESSRQ